MFVCFATTPLKDGTRGFRFTIAGIKGLTRKRTWIKRYGFTQGKCMKAYHFGKRTVYIEQRTNKTKARRVRHFAG